MRSGSRAAVVGIVLGLLGTGATAQQFKVPCDAFVKNDDNSWSALRSVPISGVGEAFTVREGSVLRPGAAIRGVDLASILDQQCPATPEPPAPAAAAQPAAPPRVSLGNYLDAGGVIDTPRLTCAQLADASPDEAGLFLAWYSGWYSGAAKKRGLNLGRTQNAIQTVVGYCRANRDKKLVQVLDLMLK